MSKFIPTLNNMFFDMSSLIEIYGVNSEGVNTTIKPKSYKSLGDVIKATDKYKEDNNFVRAFAVRIDSQYILYRTKEKYRKVK